MDYPGQQTMDFTQGFRSGQVTSKAADDSITKSGLKATQCQQVFTAVRNHANGGTMQEIAKAGKIDPSIVWRRLSSLRDNQYLRNGDNRKCNVSHRLSKTWFVI